MHLLGRSIPRRTFLRGMGAAVALPFLDAMRPAGALAALTNGGRGANLADATRLVAIEMVHGAAGANEVGSSLNLWAPPTTGRDFQFGSSALRSLEPFRDRLNIYSNTDVRMAEAMSPEEIGGDHFRASAVFLTQAHPKQTEGSDVHVGPSLDQLYAGRFGQDTPIPSMQLCIENIDQSGGCAYGYTCVYTDSISWASETEPLPVIRDPRVAFEQLFGAGSTAEERAMRLQTDRSILDWITGRVSALQRELGPTDRQRLERYLENVREVERRIQRIEAYNESGEERALPTAPRGVPDSFREHVEIMFDLQALAFQSDMTRVFSFKMGRDSSARVYPESGSDRPFHPASHHGGRESSVLEFNKINTYHVSMLPYFLEKLDEISEGDETLLDKTMLIYGSPMGDSNLHNHKRCPLIVLGGANGRLDTGRHVRFEDGTPMANVMLSLMHTLGMDDMESFGDSSGAASI